jgi:hypothetical protein
MSSSAPIPFVVHALPADTESPVILDLGKKKRKQIQELCRGEGELIGEMQGCIDELRSSGVISASAQPVVLIVREKRRRKRVFWPGL